MSTENPEKIPKQFVCDNCDYVTSSYKDYKKHLLTRKHQLATKSTQKIPKNPKLFNCDCGKQYKDRTGLWRHKKVCMVIQEEEKNKEIEETKSTEMMDMMKFMMKEMTSMNKELISEIIPKIQPHNTTNNQILNINMFLNEQCKDALNMSEFIESIQLTADDVTNIGKLGQTKGMSNILIDKLNSLDIFKRPMHCSDVKKEIIYIKDDNKWEEENKERNRLKIALNKMTDKSIKTLPELEEDPDNYIKTASEILKDPREDKKIISQIAKEVVIN